MERLTKWQQKVMEWTHRKEYRLACVRALGGNFGLATLQEGETAELHCTACGAIGTVDHEGRLAMTQGECKNPSKSVFDYIGEGADLYDGSPSLDPKDIPD